ncbi:MAG: LysM peptidoglycan-binding domain-containing protein [Hyphomicrobiales bacterium]|nr:LysM peptidoglycan-binding domain-containing protein [Hyphomicrobiales bacterium]MBV8443864.1 LysM peptidoglycan-binding domain-containing protein [Hyphomicrobiales bacterium]
MLAQNSAVWAGATGAAIVVVGAAALYVAHPRFIWPGPADLTVSERESPPAAASQSSAAPVVAAAEPPTAPLSATKPAFDVVNVEPTGEAVVAGRAAPNAKVELRDAGKTVAEATTDSAGQFVMIPPALAPGAHSLTLATGSGQSPAETSNAIPVAVPEPPPKEAVAAPPPSPAETRPSPTGAGPAPASAKVAVQSVEASAGGRLVAKGAADPNSTVRLYLSGAFVGDAKTKADGRWSLTIEHGMTPGAYEVRADQINPATAAVAARAEAPFEFPAAPQAAPASVVASADDKAAAPAGSPADVVIDSIQTHQVAHGHTLWGISQKYYGDGSRYRIIFAANTNQIHDPHWIYPGQVFVVPKTEPKP